MKFYRFPHYPALLPIFLLWMMFGCMSQASAQFTGATSPATDTLWLIQNDSVIYTDKHNIGLGTNNPNGNLHIESQNNEIRFIMGYDSSDYYTARIIRCSDEGGVIMYDDDEYTNAVTNSPPRRTIDSISAWRVSRRVSSNTDSSYWCVDFAEPDTGVIAWNPRLFVGSDGKVGIGTTDPQEALDIDGFFRVSGLANASSVVADQSGKLISGPAIPESLEDLQNVNVTGGTLLNSVLSYDGSSWEPIDITNLSTDDDWLVSSAVNSMTSAVDLVGIGVTSPEAPLHVGQFFGPANAYFTSAYDSDSTEILRVEFVGQGNQNPKGIVCSIEPLVGKGVAALFQGGQFGLIARNTTPSLQKSALFDGDMNLYGDLLSTGLVLNISDQRLKQNINPLSKGLETIMQLEPKEYEFKRDEYESLVLPEGTQYGMLAQDIQALMPELVVEESRPVLDEGDEEIEFLAVNQMGLIPVLVQGMKDQQAIIEEQKEQLQLQNEMIQSQHERLAKIEAMLSQAQEASPAVGTSQSSELFQNIPNPFNEQTDIPYFVHPEAQNAFIIIQELHSGREVARYPIQSRGFGKLEVDAKQWAAGTYFYKLIIDGQEVGVKKMVLFQ